MDISLRPELEAYIGEKVKAGEYDTADEVVNDAISLLREEQSQDEFDDDEAAELRQELSFAIAELDRGEGIEISGEKELRAFFDGIMSRGREWLKAKQQTQ